MPNCMLLIAAANQHMTLRAFDEVVHSDYTVHIRMYIHTKYVDVHSCVDYIFVYGLYLAVTHSSWSVSVTQTQGVP